MALVAGTTILAFCSKCKSDTDHILLDLVEKGKRVTKVRCGKCGDEHAFRKPKSGSRSRRAGKADRPSKSRKPRAPEAVAADEWAEVEAMVAAAQRIPYAITGAFEKGQVIEHSSFGTGVVLTVLGPGKIEVLFRVGHRKLICARK